MEKASLKAYAKINIGLDITGKRDDGYHLLQSCMQTVNLFDTVTVSRHAGSGDIEIASDNPFVPLDEANIAWKAANLIKEQFGIREGVFIDIQKRIPMAAGLAGGSADGAAVIKAMNILFDLRMKPQEMDGCALRLGADVPFCLRKGLWLCEGIGEVLSELPAMEGLCAVIVKPDFDVSTKWCYEEYDAIQKIKHPDMKGLLDAIRTGSVGRACACAGNALESATCRAYPLIDEIKQILKSYSAEAALMSGSGSAVFGLFSDWEKAGEALAYFKEKPRFPHCFLAEFVY